MEYTPLKSKPGLVLILAAATCGVLVAQEYEGPTVLSRSGGGLRPYGARSGEEAKLRVFASVQAIYDYGFLPFSTGNGGGINKLGGQPGYEGKLGIYGTKRWRRASLGLDYTGSYRGYTTNTYYNGADNFLGLEFGDQLNRRTLLTGTATAGTSNRVFSFASSLVGSPLGNILPTTDIFDARTYFISGGMGISHQFNSRLGIEIRGEGYRVERHVSALVSVQGYSPKMALSYRINRRMTVGGIYNFFHYDYPKQFGETNVHVSMAYVNYEFNRMWRLETQGGVFVADSAGTRSVAADPIVQQLLGVRTVNEAFSRVVVLPNAQIRLTGKSGNSAVSFSAYRGVGAGNGVTLSSSEQTGTLAYHYLVSKNISLNAVGSYTGAVGLSGTSDRYTTVMVGFNADYNTQSSLNYNFNARYRRSIAKAGFNFNADAYQIGIGVGWNLRDVPFFH